MISDCRPAAPQGLVLQLPRSHRAPASAVAAAAGAASNCSATKMDLLCRAAAMDPAGTLAPMEVSPGTRCQRNGRRDCAAAIRVGGVQEHRQLAAFRDCGSSRASAFTLGAGRWGSNAAALPVVTRVARCARIARIAWCAGGPEGVGGRAAAAAAAVAAAAATTSCAANQQKRDSQRRILLCASASGAQAAVPEPLSVHSARAHDRTDTAASANLVPEQTSARKNLLKPKPALSSPL